MRVERRTGPQLLQRIDDLHRRCPRLSRGDAMDPRPPRRSPADGSAWPRIGRGLFRADVGDALGAGCTSMPGTLKHTTELNVLLDCSWGDGDLRWIEHLVGGGVFHVDC